jgi:RHS repeat-associated protein
MESITVGPAGSILNLIFGYDPNGNIISVVDANSPTGVETLENPETYSYLPGTNKLSQISGTPSTTFGYDDNGNITSETTLPHAFTYVHDSSNQLKQVLYDGNEIASYTYNGAGQRIKKVAGGTTRIFHYDLRGHLIAETDQNQQMVAEYVYLGDQLLAMIKPGENVYYYHNDHLGTPQVLTDDSQGIAWKAVYTPFGEAVVSNPSVENPFRFPGQYYDAETGLHYNYFRYYNPQTGRYMTPDPIGLEGGVNLFAYVRGNPLRWFDRWGLIWEYHIRTGQLWYFPGGPEGTEGAGEFVEEGYSGRGDGLNNPLYGLEKNVGPIPEGEYSIGPPYSSPFGDPTFRLTPKSGTEMPGRDPYSFLIHADNECECLTASKGCIVLSQKTRKKIAASGDRDLRVVR